MAFPAILSTIVKNNSASSRWFGYLGAHGKELAAGATHTEPGDLIAKVSARPLSSRHKRMADALATDLQAGTLVIHQHSISVDLNGSNVPHAILVGSGTTVAGTDVSNASSYA